MTTQTHAPLRADSIRLPADLRAYLQAEAKGNTRSYSGEIVHRLEASRKADSGAKKKNGAISGKPDSPVR